jgi:hypothetical protein
MGLEGRRLVEERHSLEGFINGVRSVVEEAVEVHRRDELRARL